MIVVDILVVAILLLALVSGVHRGLVANLGIVAGIALGGLAAYALSPVIVGALPMSTPHALATVLVAVMLLGAGTVLGAAAGHVLHRGVERSPLRGADRVLGGVVTTVVAALVLSFTASTITITGAPAVSAAVGSSRILGIIDDLTPSPVSAGMSQLRSVILDDGLPHFDALLTPAPVAPPSPLDLGTPELAAAAASVARISGTADACGLSVTGSGFVVAPGRVLTNAHVVAGVANPLVQLPGDVAEAGVVVYFDVIADIAVIAVDGLEAAPLALADDLPTGAAGAVQGYPFGGPFETVDAAVLTRETALVPDIYDGPASPRDVYALRTDVRPGNSGGPLLDAAGLVAGMVFARGADDVRQGYAMTDDVIRPVAEAADDLAERVDTGACIAA